MYLKPSFFLLQSINKNVCFNITQKINFYASYMNNTSYKLFEYGPSERVIFISPLNLNTQDNYFSRHLPIVQFIFGDVSFQVLLGARIEFIGIT